MEAENSTSRPGIGARLSLAFRVFFDSAFAAQVEAGLKALAQKPATPEPKKEVIQERPPERAHASGLFVLSALQREGRLIDFLQQDVAGFSDTDVGAAARVVHTGCAKALKQYFELEPAVDVPEGSTMTVPSGFDAQRLRLTGNVTGQPPFKGTVTHHGWVAKAVRLPSLQDNLDPKFIAPAEIELS